MDTANVDNWVLKNTFDVKNYKDYYYLLSIKRKKNLSISVILPTLEEEKTIGNILKVLITELQIKVPLIDEIIVIDGGSKDNTINVCNNYKNNITLLHEDNILTDYETRKGKGNQLWKALYHCNSDIVVFMDSDLKNFDERFAIGIIGPLLTTDNIKFVKGYYDRKLSTNSSTSNEGGRVTELCARPLINLLYPDLAGFIQPLSGEYGGYSNILKNIYFNSGYGVEMKILIEILNKYNINCMGQVNLYSKEHDHQPLNALTKMSYTIIKTMLHNQVFMDLTTNNKLLIKNINNNGNNNSNLKIRSEEHEHCNSHGNNMKNSYFKYIQSDDIDLLPINLMDKQINKNNININYQKI